MLDPLRLMVCAALIAGTGAALLLSELRWFRRVSLTDRLLPFSDSNALGTRNPVISIRDLVLPRAITLSERLAKLFGVEDDLATRLRRAGRVAEPAAFRLQQLAWCIGAVVSTLLAMAIIRPPAVVIPLFVVGVPLLAFLVHEQLLASAVDKRRGALFSELPVVSEQLAMLLSAGYSLGSALNRLADRNRGVSGDDLRHVCTRVRQGVSTAQALNEWAELADVAELRRLVAVLTLSNETNDLGRLVADEANAIRREAQRQLSETIERRSQQVWVPVTVATLVPGVIFLTIPFLQALQIFSTN